MGVERFLKKNLTMRVFIYSKMFGSIKNYTTVISFFSSLVGCPILLFTKKKKENDEFYRGTL